MFFFPFSDDNPTTNKPIVCYCIIALCIFVFLWQNSLPENLNGAAIYNFGVVPAALLGDQESFIPSFMTIFTSMFMHGGWMHLIGNMVFLWIFGDNIEDSMGKVSFLIFYLVCGIFAALLQAFIDPVSQIPMIGASGAIAGVLGAYLLLHPRANVNVLMWIIIFITVIRVPAFIVLGLWIVSQFFSLTGNMNGGIAYFAHIGGFIAGMALIPWFKNSQVVLFGDARSKSFSSFKLNSSNNTGNFMEDFINQADKDKRH
jgi:membrane associated rhomboid family serine protease